MLYVGIDWASDHHDLAALSPEGQLLQKARVPHSAEGFEGIRDHLAKLGVPPEHIAVALEMHEGPLVLWLLDQGYRVYGINPRMADRARDRLSAVGAKDDARDALSLGDFLRTQAARLCGPLGPKIRPRDSCGSTCASGRTWSRSAPPTSSAWGPTSSSTRRSSTSC